MKDYYAILGVPFDADLNFITAAYKALDYSLIMILKQASLKY